MARTGFYGWIRDGVRRAVLLGLSDAVEQMGEADADQIRGDLAQVLRPHRATKELPEASREHAATPGRRRLGRGLSAAPSAPAGHPSPPA